MPKVALPDVPSSADPGTYRFLQAVRNYLVQSGDEQNSGSGGVASAIVSSSTLVDPTALIQAPNDTVAASRGVPLYGLYWNGSVLQARRT